MVPKQRNSGITCNSRPVHCCSARRRSQHRPGRTGRTPSRSTRRSWGSRGTNPYFPLTPEYRLSYKHRSDAVRGLAARLCRRSIGQRIPRGARLGAGFRRKPILPLLPLSLCCVGLSVKLRASRTCAGAVHGCSIIRQDQTRFWLHTPAAGPMCQWLQSDLGNRDATRSADRRAARSLNPRQGTGVAKPRRMAARSRSRFTPRHRPVNQHPALRPEVLL